MDAVTSAQQWSSTTPAAITTTPAVSGGLVYVASGDTVYAVSNRALVWQRTPSSGSVISIAPLVGDELVYVLAGTSITALIADTGGTRGVSGRNSRVMTTPVVDDTSLVVLDTTTQSTAPLERSFDATDGTALWSTALPVARGQYDGPLAAAGGVVYAGATDFTYAVRESDGVRLRSFATGGDRGGPAVSNGALYLPDSINGGLVRYAVPPAAARRRPVGGSARPRVVAPEPEQGDPLTPRRPAARQPVKTSQTRHEVASRNPWRRPRHPGRALTALPTLRVRPVSARAGASSVHARSDAGIRQRSRDTP